MKNMMNVLDGEQIEERERLEKKKSKKMYSLYACILWKLVYHLLLPCGALRTFLFHSLVAWLLWKLLSSSSIYRLPCGILNINSQEIVICIYYIDTKKYDIAKGMKFRHKITI
jgi:hypothetical protein